MRPHLLCMLLCCLTALVGCASILVPDPSTKSLAAQQQDRDECAAEGVRAAQEYAWSPLADLTLIRIDREDECLESRGYVTTTRVFMHPTSAGGASAEEPPDPIRRCFQQAYAWMGRYDGPIDGRSNVAWTAAQQAYVVEQQVTGDHPRAPGLMHASLRRDLRALGREADWQACLDDAAQPH
jgi:hypothetical protein